MKIKGVTLLIAVGMLLTCGGSVSAQKRMSDYIYLGGSIGYSRFQHFESVPEMDVKGLYDFGLQFGYEFRYDFFLLRLGGNLQYFGSSCESNVTVGDVRIVDTRYGDATMHYNMLSPLKETQRFLTGGVAFMVGYSMNDYQDRMPNGGLYVLGGVKVMGNFTSAQNNSAELSYATTATYDRYIDDYENMPNHYYMEMQSSAKPEFKMSYYVAACLEVGWEFNMRYFDKLKVGAFLDWGITNIMGEETSVVKCEPDAEDALKVNVDTYYRSEAMSGKYVVPIMVGVSVSYSWNMTNATHCSSVRCKPYRTK